MKNLQAKLQKQFDIMCAKDKLFVSSIGSEEVWKTYLNAFSDENDPVFRDPESSTHNCNHCKNFLRRYGNIVAINEADNSLITLFDIKVEEEFQESFDQLNTKLKQAEIKDVFVESYDVLNSLPYETIKKDDKSFALGVAVNSKVYTKKEAEKYGVVKEGEMRNFYHLSVRLPNELLDFSGKSVEAVKAEHRDAKEVFKRGMEEISLDTLYLVRDLISQGSLLNGTTYLEELKEFMKVKELYEKLSGNKDNWCWKASHKYYAAKFKNKLIGVLCTELSEGKDINKACLDWNKRVDPANYMKATAPITQKQIKAAQNFVEENGLEESFNRRFATIDDIKATEIKHINSGDGNIKKASLFDDVKPTKSRHKRNEFDNVEEVSIEKFMKGILPECSTVEAYLENRHSDNMVSLTTSENKNSKSIFKWDNNYSWTFNGNLAGKSEIKNAVKSAGGNVDGIMNFRLAWNGRDGNDSSDLDAWAREPGGHSIGYSTHYRKDRGNRSRCSGQLDVDNMDPHGKLAVENITWTDKNSMKDGVYSLWVNQYTARNSQGFKAEIEIEGEVYSYSYNNPVSGNVQVAKITLKNGHFSIEHLLPESLSSKEIYGLETNNFHKVNLMCLSPNHWGDNSIGHKHFMFMLENCKAPDKIRSFHNENLAPKLLKHRKVMEILGNTKMIESDKDQLSGLGFNSTVKDELVVRLSGNFKRVLKIKF